MAGMFYTWEASRHPHTLRWLPNIWMPQTPQCPPYVQTPPYVPNAPLCICMFWGYLHVIGGCWGPPIWTNPSVGCLPICPTHLHIYMLPCMCVCSRVIACIMGETSHMLGGWGHFSTSVRLLVSVSTSIGCSLCFILYPSCSSLCLKSLLPLLWLLLLRWLWCLLVCHIYHWWPWLPLWWGFLQCLVSVMWFCHHPLHQEALEVFLAMPLYHSSNPHLWCLFTPVPIMPWVLHR